MNSLKRIKRVASSLFVILSFFQSASAQLTIEECVSKAEANYPLVRKYGLLKATRDIELSEINRSWLPRLSAYGQATIQNVVPSFPSSLSGVLDQMGQTVRGLGRLQYKVGIDLSQSLWDGGASRVRRDVARAQEATRSAALDVELYDVRRRVGSLFFAVLLTDRQIELTEVTHRLLEINLRRLQAMIRDGVAMQSDADMVEARYLSVGQSITEAKSASDGYRRVLELFIGENLDGVTFVLPDAQIPATETSDRPELRLFGRRMDANRALDRLSDVSLMPRVGLFAQAYYGYPGFDYFNSMMSRDLSFNILAGVKVAWNIDAFYSRKNNRRRTSVDTRDIAADRDLFLFNSEMQVASQSEAIAAMREVMKNDARIIELQQNVRKAAEAQLEEGVIDTTALLSKISDENIARLNGELHIIRLQQEIYNLKYTLNR
ncbi:MAG: TolC family protein [Muribaculaceae bacterium]|nr:TolC family protein [Muribaculaceae bacterium]